MVAPEIKKYDKKKSDNLSQKARESKEYSDKNERKAFTDIPLKQLISRAGKESSVTSHALFLKKTADSNPTLAKQALLILQQQYGNRYVQRVVDLSRNVNNDASVAPEIEQSIQRARGSGRGLDRNVRAQMESSFDADFNDVRVHTSSQADALNRALSSRAFTTGKDIFFRQDEYSPGSFNGRKLLAHELTHVVQQTGGVHTKISVGQPGDKYELEADRVAEQIMRMPEVEVQQQPEEEEKEELQAKSVSGQLSHLVQGQAEEEEEEVIQPKYEKNQAQQQAGNDNVLQQNAEGVGIEQIFAHHAISTIQRTMYDEDWLALLGQIEGVRARMDLRFHRVTNFSTNGMRAAETVRTKLMALSTLYEGAYGNYAATIRAAREEARNQEQWINICIGITAGVLLSVGAAFILPSSAAGAFAITANEAAIATASAVGQAGAGAAIATGATSILTPAGTNLEPGGILPSVVRMNVWRNVARLYRQASQFVETGRNLHMLSGAAEFLIGEIRVHRAGGETTMTEDDVVSLANDLISRDREMARLDEEISDSLQHIADLQLRANQVPTDRILQVEMEQDIWILWMSGLVDPSVLDRDPIENRLHSPEVWLLGDISRLGVNFGTVWTSDNDERMARDAARVAARGLRQRFRELQGASLR